MLESLYRGHRRQAYLVAWSYLRDEEEALDAVQEAFVRAQRAIAGFDGRCQPYTWYHRILVNVCIDRRRSKQRRPETIVSTLDDGSVPAARIEPATARGELRSLLLEGLAALGDTHREIIVMREILGLSYAEIAGSMKCRRGTVMSRLFRARQQLRAFLEQRLGALH